MSPQTPPTAPSRPPSGSSTAGPIPTPSDMGEDPASGPDRGPKGHIGWIVTGSIAAGLVVALLLVTAPFIPAQTGARLVSMENVYMYGRPNGRPLTENRPDAAHTTKRRLRARLASELLAAHRACRVPVAIGRASDYFGPHGGAQSNLGDRVFPAATAGNTATVLGDADQPHTYTYIPHIGEGLAILGEHPDAPGQIWHLPNDPDTKTTRQLVDIVYQQAGHSRAKLRVMPALLLRVVGLANPTVRELIEMQYQFDEPFIVDSNKISTHLDVHATPIDQALADTVATYRTPVAASRRT
jgi:nucleoside-diphosphate-sugar epimerase